jgi:hypothetical protein
MTRCSPDEIRGDGAAFDAQWFLKPRISLRSSGLQIPPKRTDVIVLLIDMSTLICVMRWARHLNRLAA